MLTFLNNVTQTKCISFRSFLGAHTREAGENTRAIIIMKRQEYRVKKEKQSHTHAHADDFESRKNFYIYYNKSRKSSANERKSSNINKKPN